MAALPGETKNCPFKNLPEARRGQWGEGLTAAEMEKCRWLKPQLIATIDYLERTVANHPRHAMFVGLTKNSGFRASEGSVGNRPGSGTLRQS